MATWLAGAFDAALARSLRKGGVRELFWCSPYCSVVKASEEDRTRHRSLCDAFNRYALEAITERRRG